MKSIQNINKLLLFITVVFFIPSCAVNPVTGKRQLMFISKEQEIQMGKEYDKQVMATFGAYEDDDLLEFIREKGTEMGKISHRPELEYHFRIVDTPVMNAFAVPGGYIYFTRGILAQFNNEAALMGVLGHEMGHITARHTVSQQTKQQLGQLLLIGGIIVSERFRDFAGYAMQGMQLLFLKFSRDNERQSDRLGVEYASKIHYDSKEMGDFFAVLERMQMESTQGGVPTFFSTHPDPGDRQEKVTELTEKWQEKLNFTDWMVNERSYMQMIDGMVYGEDPRQGYKESDVFYHPDMKFRFPVPGTWILQNTAIQVQMAPSDGEAIIVFMLAKQESAGEALKAALQDLNLTLINSERTSVNGLPAVAAVSQQETQDQRTGQQQNIQVLSYFIEYEGRVYVFHGVSDAAAFNSYSGIFESTMTGFNRLTDPSKLNVKPKRLRVVQVKQSGSLEDIFRNYGVSRDQMEELALLNNRELSEQINAGALLKIIRDE